LGPKQKRVIVADVETNATGMAGRYASALFALAQEQHVTDRVAADLDAFVGLLRDSPDLYRLVRSPVFSAEEQVKALSAVLERTGFETLTVNFLKLVATKRRLFAVEEMIRDFKGLFDTAKGVTHARVTVAQRLSPAEWDDLERTLSEISGKSVRMDVFIDPDIIGGLVVKLGSRMIDGSVRTKLNAIRTRMKEVG
jgi:F-type H+-transporting ATPase subunit delta